MFFQSWGRRAHQRQTLSPFLGRPHLGDALGLLSRGKATLGSETFGTSPELFEDFSYPVLHPLKEDAKIRHQLVELNKRISDAAKERAYQRFARDAFEKIPSLIAPAVPLFETHKKLIALQLVAKERLHIYIASDPTSLVSELLRFAAALHESSVYLNVSGAKSLFISRKRTIAEDDDILIKASEGILAISDIENLKKADMQVLYAALKNGSYAPDPSSKSKRATGARILAATSATRIVGRQPDILRQQVAIPSYLQEQVHVVSVVKTPKETPSHKKFTVNKADYDFVKGFTSYAESLSVEVPKDLEQKVYGFAELLRTDEESSIVPISETVIIGMVRLAKAHARMNLRRQLRDEDVKVSYELVKTALRMPKE